MWDFIFEDYFKQIRFSQENSYCSIKHLEKRFVAAPKQVNRKNAWSS